MKKSSFFPLCVRSIYLFLSFCFFCSSFSLLAIHELRRTGSIENLERVGRERSDSLTDELIKTKEFPLSPLRTLKFTNTMSNATTFTAGLAFNTYGVELGATVSAKFAMSWTSTLVLFKSSQEDNLNDPFTHSVGGEIVLNLNEGEKILGTCSYTATANAGASLLGRLSFMGTGVSNVSDMNKALLISQSTSLYEIRSVRSIHKLQKYCRKKFKSDIQKGIIRDLKNSIKANIYYDDDCGKSHEELLSHAAIFGPKVSNISYLDRNWNVSQASVEREGKKYIISGKFDENIPMKIDNVYRYTFIFKEGKLVNKWTEHRANIFGIKSSKAVQEEALQLSEFLANEVYLNVREEEV